MNKLDQYEYVHHFASPSVFMNFRNKTWPNIKRDFQIVVLFSSIVISIIDKAFDILYYYQNEFYTAGQDTSLKDVYYVFFFVSPFIQFSCWMFIAVKYNFGTKLLDYISQTIKVHHQIQLEDQSIVNKERKKIENVIQGQKRDNIIMEVIKEILFELQRIFTLSNILNFVLSIPISMCIIILNELRILPFMIFYWMRHNFKSTITSKIMDSVKSGRIQRKTLTYQDLYELSSIQIWHNIDIPWYISILNDVFLLRFLSLIDFSQTIFEALPQSLIHYINNNYLDLWKSPSSYIQFVTYTSFVLGAINIYMNCTALLIMLFGQFVDQSQQILQILKVFKEQTNAKSLIFSIQSSLIVNDPRDISVLKYLKINQIQHLIFDFSQIVELDLSQAEEIYQFILYYSQQRLRLVEFKNMKFEIHKQQSINSISNLLFNLQKLESLQIVLDQYGRYIVQSRGINIQVLIEQIDISGWDNNVEFYETFSHSNLEEVTILKIQNTELEDHHLKYISQGKYIELEVLDVKDNLIRSNGIQYLSTATFSNLKTLFMDNNLIKDGGCLQIIEGKLVSLVNLSLSNNEIQIIGVKYLAFGKIDDKNAINTLLFEESGPKYQQCLNLRKLTLPNLQVLNLSQNEIGSLGTNSIFTSLMQNIISLDISDNGIFKGGCRNVFKCNFVNLKILKINQNRLYNEGIQDIVKGTFLGLEELEISSNHVTDLGIEYLCSGNLKKLNKIIVKNNYITKQGLHTLLKSDLIQLRYIDLENNQLDNLQSIDLQQRQLKQLKILKTSIDISQLMDIQSDVQLISLI